MTTSLPAVGGPEGVQSPGVLQAFVPLVAVQVNAAIAMLLV
jgi:hypothetical protein